jgi:hypothetical protein
MWQCECGAKYQLREDRLGKKVRCSQCGVVSRMGKPSSIEAPPPLPKSSVTSSKGVSGDSSIHHGRREAEFEDAGTHQRVEQCTPHRPDPVPEIELEDRQAADTNKRKKLTEEEANRILDEIYRDVDTSGWTLNTFGKNALIRLFVNAFLLAGLAAVLYCFDAAGVPREGPVLGKAFPLGIIIFGTGMLHATFSVCLSLLLDGWE